MKIRINGAKFRELVAVVAPATSKGTSITSGIHLQADDLGRIVATATDYGLTIQTWGEADEVEEEGAMVLPAALLLKILGTLPDGIVQLVTAGGPGGGGVLEVAATRFELAGFPAEEFPQATLEPPEGRGRVEVPRAHLAAGLRATVPFTDDTGNKQPLDCVLVHLGRDRLAMAATDSHRLGSYSVEILGVPERLFLLPRPMAAGMAAALARSPEASPWIASEGLELAAVIGPTTIRARGQEAKFPDYSRVIPAEIREETVTVNRASLRESARRVVAMAQRDQSGCAMVALNFGPNGIELEAHSADVGKARDRVDLFSNRRSSTRIGLNAAYLVAALDVFAAELVNVQAEDQFSPVRITCDAEPGTLHVCMPMRLS